MKMRMVGYSEQGFVIIQFKLARSTGWHQHRLTFAEFEKLMRIIFPKHYKYYEIAKDNEEREINENGLEGFDYPTSNCSSWFYNFGETKEMRIKGESFVFTK